MFDPFCRPDRLYHSRGPRSGAAPAQTRLARDVDRSTRGCSWTEYIRAPGNRALDSGSREYHTRLQRVLLIQRVNDGLTYRQIAQRWPQAATHPSVTGSSSLIGRDDTATAGGI